MENTATSIMIESTIIVLIACVLRNIDASDSTVSRTTTWFLVREVKTHSIVFRSYRTKRMDSMEVRIIQMVFIR